MMNLIILGKENLDELQELAEKLFNDVVDRNNELPKWTTNPYGRDEVQQWVKVIPIKDIRHLKITFPIIDTSEDYKCLVSFFVWNYFQGFTLEAVILVRRLSLPSYWTRGTRLITVSVKEKILCKQPSCRRNCLISRKCCLQN